MQRRSHKSKLHQRHLCKFHISPGMLKEPLSAPVAPVQVQQFTRHAQEPPVQTVHSHSTNTQSEVSPDCTQTMHFARSPHIESQHELYNIHDCIRRPNSSKPVLSMHNQLTLNKSTICAAESPAAQLVFLLAVHLLYTHAQKSGSAWVA